MQCSCATPANNMKRCPECRRDYYDDSLLYCLDDGSALLDGPASTDEPATAILSDPRAAAAGSTAGEDQTRLQLDPTARSSILPSGAGHGTAKSGLSGQKL